MKVLAIIPARGGSKGIPRKNIIPLAGKPMIAWNIEAANSSKYIQRVVVSTDDREIATISQKFGAEVVMRPEKLSGDTATSESALMHVIKTLRSQEDYFPELIVFLQCTSPLTNADDIDNCIEKLLKENADSATTVKDFHYFVWKEIDKSAEGINHDKKFRPRRQDREPQYLETGAVYVMRTKGFLENKHRFFGKTVLSKMPEERCFEIDEPIDMEIAELLLRKQLKNTKVIQFPKKIGAVIFDFDGVMTDDKVVVDQDGKESVICNRGDGMGIDILKKYPLKIAVLSTESNVVVGARCRKLGIECFQNLGHTKYEKLESYCQLHNLKLDEVIYVGNDINDIECLKNVGLSVCPADAHNQVKKYAQLILQNKGGEGAVREICDLIIDVIK